MFNITYRLLNDKNARLNKNHRFLNEMFSLFAAISWAIASFFFSSSSSSLLLSFSLFSSLFFSLLSSFFSLSFSSFIVVVLKFDRAADKKLYMTLRLDEYFWPRANKGIALCKETIIFCSGLTMHHNSITTL